MTSIRQISGRHVVSKEEKSVFGWENILSKLGSKEDCSGVSRAVWPEKEKRKMKTGVQERLDYQPLITRRCPCERSLGTC